MFRTPSRQVSRPTTPSTPMSQNVYTGSISVSIRIKPSTNYLQHTNSSITIPEIGEFTFDNVFGPQTDNLEIYNSLVKDMVQKVIEGFNATIFAYGMTGSGKTHSMSGTDKELGLIPLAIQEIFELISEKVEIKVSYLEIYNEKINDLLNPINTDLKLREDENNLIQVLGITENKVKSSIDLLNLIQKGDENRKTNSTEFNLKSSRSHAIVQLKLISNNSISILSLCDLAGSERATSSNDRRKEGAYINKSLLSLTNVIVKLSNNTQSRSTSTIGTRTPSRKSMTPAKPSRSNSSLSFRSSSSLSNRESSSSTHIPYRDSKLTRLLQSSLSGDALVGILCTVSSSPPSTIVNNTTNNANNGILTETINTLRFASRAKNIKLHAKRHEVVLTSNDKDKLIEKLRIEISQKDAEIRSLQKSKPKINSMPNLNDPIEIQELKENLNQLEAENKILIENQTHLKRLLESRNFNSTIFKNDLISKILNDELNYNEIVLNLEELFKSKYLEIEEYKSYITHLENLLNNESIKSKQSNGSENSEIQEELSDLKKTLNDKEKIIKFLKNSIRSNDMLKKTINNKSNESDLSGVLEIDEDNI